ncbi:MAG: hypothetical protein A2Y57_04175 [Candidatus Woykebacteria bacterium RBG_13_40_7b]|uniref:Uncharacterized protein n=1 Tax=Candidatus Woykebacteria bacterium RBG_13_40_7b TaxID=1802594 RepID=A0A1G1W9A3_9BACT|nr:MAG: hypothetical protein A2Y57_04175 [Candidatus Woykebacteria bacterium RBG_13_40_7b]
MLRERGPVGVKNWEFPQHFILNYKARLDELREKGWSIKTVRVDGNVWKYVLEEKIPAKESWQSRKRQEDRVLMEERGQARLL